MAPTRFFSVKRPATPSLLFVPSCATWGCLTGSEAPSHVLGCWGQRTHLPDRPRGLRQLLFWFLLTAWPSRSCGCQARRTTHICGDMASSALCVPSPCAHRLSEWPHHCPLISPACWGACLGSLRHCLFQEWPAFSLSLCLQAPSHRFLYINALSQASLHFLSSLTSLVQCWRTARYVRL